MLQTVKHQVRPEAFQKRDNQLRRIRAVRGKDQQRDAYGKADTELQDQFFLPRQSQVPALRHFRVVVYKSNRRERNQREERQQNKRVRQIGPKQNRHGGGKHDQHATHRRSAGFFLVLLRPFLADVLSNLQFAQLADQPRPKHQRQKHRRQTRICRAHGDVAEHVQGAEIFLQHMVEEVVKHPSAPPPISCLHPLAQTGQALLPRCVPSSRCVNLSPAASHPASRNLSETLRHFQAWRKTSYVRAELPLQLRLLQFAKRLPELQSQNRSFPSVPQIRLLRDAIGQTPAPVRAFLRQPVSAAEILA